METGAVYRRVYPMIWRRPTFRALPDSSKLLFLYLLTCPHGHLAGIFTIGPGTIEDDTGWQRKAILDGMAQLQQGDFARYDRESSILLLNKFLRYNPLQNPGCAVNAVRHVKALPPSPLIATWAAAAVEFCPRFESIIRSAFPPPEDGGGGRPPDPPPDGGGETEAETEAGKNLVGRASAPPAPVPFDAIVAHLNEKTGRQFRASNQQTQRFIRARWNEGYREDAFRAVVAFKAAVWGKDAHMLPYLRPETLFGTKFEAYLQEAQVKLREARAEEERKANMPKCFFCKGGSGIMKAGGRYTCSAHYLEALRRESEDMDREARGE